MQSLANATIINLCEG